MISVTKRYSISASHHLEDYEGKCHRTHGHNYVIEATVSAASIRDLMHNNILLDFGDMKKDLEVVVGIADHYDLNEVYNERNPTAEYLAARWLEQLRQRDGRYTRVRVYETEDGYAEATA